MSKKKVAVFIGRFQPLHNGHMSIIQKALDEFETLLILVGSANRRCSIKNYFSAEDRIAMLNIALREAVPSADVRIAPINDYLYNDTKWETEVYYTVHQLLDDAGNDDEISLVGFEKDDSSYYLKSFPQWDLVEYNQNVEINSTDIRQGLFTAVSENSPESWEAYAKLLTQHTPKNIRHVMGNVELMMERYNLRDLIGEHWFYESEQEKFKDFPYPETLKFMCSDAAVICKGHILLIQRKFAPGRNTWALPGGFVGQRESFDQAALRELIEETSIKVPKRALEGKIKAAAQSIKTAKMFDNPNRSLGIPRVSMAYCIEVEADPSGRLPRVKASDDAQDAKWVPLAKAKSMKLYDDHSDIIDYFTGSM